ncbi:MAG: T9SS type A sorting domain-containing protein [Bacteroidales bacterium]|nr:T9SS type A sorting domain-containing protein [Bacteroidales bacterium]
MRIIFTLFIFITFVNNLSSQSFEWVHGRDIDYELNPNMLSYSVTTSPDGTIWQGGMKNFVEFYNEAMGNLFLAQYNSNGNLLHEYEITGSATLNDMETDSEGNLYVTGQTLNTLHFWDGSQLLYNNTFIEGFLLKVSPSGTIEWAINLSTLFANAVPEDLAVYQDHVYLAHSEWSESNITEFDADGNVVRTIQQMNVPLATGLALDLEGNVYASGSCSDTQGLFGGVSYPTLFSYSKYLVKYNPQGFPQWVKFVEDITCTTNKVSIDNIGRIIWSGPLFMEAIFDTLTLMGPSWGSDFFVTAFNGEGQVQWGFEVPQVLTGNSELGKSKPISILPDNSISITGSTLGTIDWGNGVVTSSDDFSSQTIVLNLSSEGQPNWAKTGIAEGYSEAVAIDGDSEGNLYITGISHGTTQFDTCSYTNDSYYYPYLAKLAADLNTGIPDDYSAKCFAVYPNPANDHLMVESGYPGPNTITLSSLSGKEVLRVSGSNRVTDIDISNVAAGVYLAKLICNTAVSVKKIIIR